MIDGFHDASVGLIVSIDGFGNGVNSYVRVNVLMPLTEEVVLQKKWLCPREDATVHMHETCHAVCS